MLVYEATNYSVDSHFVNPQELIKKAREYIKKYYDHIVNYYLIELGYPERITVNLSQVREQGVVYKLKCHIDPAAGKYDTATSALLIVKNNGEVKFIISEVDARVNLVEKGDSFWTKVNQQEIENELANLGKRVDTILFSDWDNYFVRRKKKLAKEKVDILVKNSIANLYNLTNSNENTKEEEFDRKKKLSKEEKETKKLLKNYIKKTNDILDSLPDSKKKKKKKK